jgi:hypothetical protein
MDVGPASVSVRPHVSSPKLLTKFLLNLALRMQYIVTRLGDRRRGIGLSTGFIAPYNQLLQQNISTLHPSAL